MTSRDGRTARRSSPASEVGLHVSTTAPSYCVHAIRVGWYGGGQGREVWRSATLPGVRQPPPVRGAAPHGADRLAGVGAGRHDGLASRRLPVPAGRLDRVAALRAAAGATSQRGGNGRGGQRRHDLAGLQRLRRVQPLPRPGRPDGGPGRRGLLRPAVRHRDGAGCQRVRAEHAAAGGSGRAARDRGRLRQRRRPGSRSAPVGRCPGGGADRARRVLVAAHACGVAARPRPAA